jgi:hypothetical protein
MGPRSWRYLSKTDSPKSPPATDKTPAADTPRGKGGEEGKTEGETPFPPEAFVEITNGLEGLEGFLFLGVEGRVQSTTTSFSRPFESDTLTLESLITRRT